MIKSKHLTLLGILTPFLIVPTSYAASVNYIEYISNIAAHDLGTLPHGKDSSARDINDDGYIVGYSDVGALYGKHNTTQTSSLKSSNALSQTEQTLKRSKRYTMSIFNINLLQNKRAFVIDGNGMRSLGTLPNGGDSFAYGISNNGNIVGHAMNSTNTATSFFYRYNTMRDIGTYPPNDELNLNSFAYAVNTAGLIAGNIYTSGVIWDINRVSNYPPFPHFTEATEPGTYRPSVVYDINDKDQAAGTLVADGRAFRWQSGNLEKLKAFSYADDYGYAINNHGAVAGKGLLVSPLRYHAVIWPSPSQHYDLGTLGGTNSSAQDINDNSTVVGYSETATGETHAFIWRAKLGMQSLGTLGGKNSKAFSINTQGIIVGESETVTGETHATRWHVSICKFYPDSITEICDD